MRRFIIKCHKFFFDFIHFTHSIDFRTKSKMDVTILDMGRKRGSKQHRKRPKKGAILMQNIVNRTELVIIDDFHLNMA